ncbi:helix-turn-helix domain-containing protein [Nocardioides sp. CER19]|uniref:PucR family transcriptional regulator n=1 Tax=Nocardioides sp. CER19 TaxID=3038538 RepID=UPI00244B60C6|nr:helix-turn-helix domain-containing protein [Nocardioides sp. CER19]MDH2416328.1 helix-turn-helix domain-containing protein [Nocardioides sp. CER19]
MTATTPPLHGEEEPVARARRLRSAEALQRATGRLSTAATARMDTALPWFGDLTAEDRSWVGLIVQAGIRGFTQWYGGAPGTRVEGADLAASVFGAAPRALAGIITLRQTVDLIRLSIEVVEENVDDLVEPEDAPDVHHAVSRYAREVAFATAEVYARAAEQRGAWDARLEALVVDAVLRAETDESLLSRASALGWGGHEALTVVLGPAPARRTETDVFDDVRRRARAAGLDALCAVQGELLVVVLGGSSDPRAAAASVVGMFAHGSVVVGPVAEDLSGAHVSAGAALAAYRAAAGWPDAPRPVLSSELLPERALAGDDDARDHLVSQVYEPLAHARATLIETLSAYFGAGGSLEAAARELFVHPNTVRYRLRQVADLTGYTATRPRDALTLQLALVLGRQAAAAEQ